MHIQGQEGNITSLTTCTKMTEEVDRRHGMNGNSSSNGISEELPSPLPHPAQQFKGGRLKFYKDGKMILELTRSREGEKEGWVSVPRKTIWVPASSGVATPNSTTRQERAASLSVSDDNSSIQSSPWQRDHCWKQTAPRKGIGTEMCLLYVRPTCLPARLLRSPAARNKRRRPLCPAPVLLPPANGCSSPSPENSVPYRNTEKPTALGKFKFLRNKGSLAEPKVLRVYKKSKKKCRRRELVQVVEALKERLLHFTPVNTKISNCKQDHPMVSPRKRILRELEKVSLEDLANKRSRARHPLPSAPQPGPSYAPDPTPKLHNGSSNSRNNTQPSKPVSSYSIHSILSITEDSSHRSPEHSTIKKPLSYSGSSKTESPVSAHSPDSHSTRASHYSKASSPLSPDVRRSHYAYSKTDSPSPSPSPEQYRSRPPTGLSVARPPYHPHASLIYPELGEYYYTEEYPYRAYPNSLYLPSPYLGQYLGYRAPPPLVQYPALPPGPWAPLPHPLLTDPAPREDASSDLPLNLSKH